jgi:hypothetical protein
MRLKIAALYCHILALSAAIAILFGLVGCGDPEEPASEADFNLTPLTGESDSSTEDDPNFIKADPEQIDTVIADAKPVTPVVEAKLVPEESVPPENPPADDRSPFEKEAEETDEPPGDDDPKGQLEYKLKQLQVPPA